MKRYCNKRWSRNSEISSIFLHSLNSTKAVQQEKLWRDRSIISFVCKNKERNELNKQFHIVNIIGLPWLFSATLIYVKNRCTLHTEQQTETFWRTYLGVYVHVYIKPLTLYLWRDKTIISVEKYKAAIRFD